MFQFEFSLICLSFFCAVCPPDSFPLRFDTGIKIKQASQSAGGNVADAAGKVGSMVKSRWALFQETRQRRPPAPPVERVQERLISAAASTGVLLRKGFSETKEKVAVGKLKVEEV